MKNTDLYPIIPPSFILYAGRRLKLIFYSFLLFASLISCDNFMEVGLPNSQLAADNVYEDKTTATAAIIQVYAKMRDSGLLAGNSPGLSHLFGNYTDELDFYGNPQDATVPFYNNTVIPSSPNVKLLWNNGYNQIYGANAVLEGVTNSKSLVTADRDQLKGEALFIRALIHFYLTNVFGSIPYIKTTDYQKNSVVSKKTSSAIYADCIEDLTQAATFLPNTYVATDRNRPNKFAARALLARVYLHSGLWAEASNEASAVLNNTSLYGINTNLSKTFLKESTSTIWQFLPSETGRNTLEAQTFVFTIGPPPVSALSQQLLNSFEATDKRKTAWISSVSNGTTTWYYPAKYKSKSTTASTEYSIVLRLSEMYLVRAEARAHSGDLIGSKEDLNVIRNTAGLANSTAITSSEILAAILKERQLEFFTEFGHRFFDLKRYNVLDATLSDTKKGWETFESQLPLPESELLLNPNLNPQNTGY